MIHREEMSRFTLIKYQKKKEKIVQGGVRIEGLSDLFLLTFKLILPIQLQYFKDLLLAATFYYDFFPLSLSLLLSC